MKIKSGSLLEINHERKGRFLAIACADFDTDKEEFYPVAIAEQQTEGVIGLVNEWLPGEEIPCRRSFCNVEVLKQ